MRQLYRVIARFKKDGILGLIYKFRRPKTIPKKTPIKEEERIHKIREASGFGPMNIARLLEESSIQEGNPRKVQPSTIYNILVRNRETDREKRIQNQYKSFEWSHPDRLIQSDLTKFNGGSTPTMLDDHSRKG